MADAKQEEHRQKESVLGSGNANDAAIAHSEPHPYAVEKRPCGSGFSIGLGLQAEAPGK